MVHFDRFLRYVLPSIAKIMAGNQISLGVIYFRIENAIKNCLLSHSRLRPIWSRTHLIPGLPVPHFLSPWTNNPHKIDPHGQLVSIKFGPMNKWSPKIWSPGQIVPNQFGLHISRSPQAVTLDKWNILGTICQGGPNWLGTVCP